MRQPLQQYPNPRPPGVLADVGQRLLHDPIQDDLGLTPDLQPGQIPVVEIGLPASRTQECDLLSQHGPQTDQLERLRPKAGNQPT
jgi:hypothetical protein